MGQKRPDKILRLLTQNAAEIAEKATRLSDQLELVENILRELPGKFEVEVGESNGPSGSLSLARHSNDWHLIYSTYQDSYRVTSSSVSIKAAAAILVPELLATLSQKSEERLEQINAGLNALDSLPFLQDRVEDC
ncbi:hypothetical protein [Planctomicrobium sp. SH527]|uniref:hypothetical protein n=1 Tax=Planctomicrobium sp. SH527 TaxID=3448123 RepID=UPI003F5BD2C4